MRADLLEEQQGVSELYRNTYVKAIMRGDGTFLVVWAGALYFRYGMLYIHLIQRKK